MLFCCCCCFFIWHDQKWFPAEGKKSTMRVTTFNSHLVHNKWTHTQNTNPRKEKKKKKDQMGRGNTSGELHDSIHNNRMFYGKTENHNKFKLKGMKNKSLKREKKKKPTTTTILHIRNRRKGGKKKVCRPRRNIRPNTTWERKKKLEGNKIIKIQKFWRKTRRGRGEMMLTSTSKLYSFFVCFVFILNIN